MTAAVLRFAVLGELRVTSEERSLIDRPSRRRRPGSWGPPGCRADDAMACLALHHYGSWCSHFVTGAPGRELLPCERRQDPARFDGTST